MILHHTASCQDGLCGSSVVSEDVQQTQENIRKAKASTLLQFCESEQARVHIYKDALKPFWGRLVLRTEGFKYQQVTPPPLPSPS